MSECFCPLFQDNINFQYLAFIQYYFRFLTGSLSAETNRRYVLFVSASEMSTDESEHEDEEGEQIEQDQPTCRGSPRMVPPEPMQTSECWESGTTPEGSKHSGLAKTQHLVSAESFDIGKRRSQPEPEGDAPSRKRKYDNSTERTSKCQGKAKLRNTRSAEWLPSGSPRKLEERVSGPREEKGASSSSSSDDEGAALAESQTEETGRSRPKTKGSPSKKYNGMKEKTKTGRQTRFWEIPEKRVKMTVNAEERPAVRSKGQKDVWSSIQAQWPKKTLKELFSDSDTEAANSPPPPIPSCLKEPNIEHDGGVEDEASEEQMEIEKVQEYPSSGSNSALNTPPTTPESPSGGVSAMEDTGQAQTSSPLPSVTSSMPSEPVSDTLPPGPIQEELAGGRSETDSSTVEVESLGGELQDLPQDEGAGSPSKVFDVSLSCNSNSSLEISSNGQQECEQKSKGTEKSHSIIPNLQFFIIFTLR